MLSMSIFTYLLISFSVFFLSLVEVRNSAEAFPIKLTRGLAVACVTAIVECAMMAVGMIVANLLPHYEFQDVNNMIFIGLALVVAIRFLMSAFGKAKEKPVFDLSRWAGVLSLAVAYGLNIFLVGLAAGFKASFAADCYKSLIPLFLCTFFAVYLAIMLGRQKMKIKSRRWMIVSTVFLLVFVLKCALDY